MGPLPSIARAGLAGARRVCVAGGCSGGGVGVVADAGLMIAARGHRTSRRLGGAASSESEAESAGHVRPATGLDSRVRRPRHLSPRAPSLCRRRTRIAGAPAVASRGAAASPRPRRLGLRHTLGRSTAGSGYRQTAPAPHRAELSFTSDCLYEIRLTPNGRDAPSQAKAYAANRLYLWEFNVRVYENMRSTLPGGS